MELDKKARSFEVAKSMIEHVLDNFSYLLEEQKAIGSSKKVATTMIKSMLTQNINTETTKADKRVR